MLNNWKFWTNGALVMNIAAVILSFITFFTESWKPFLVTSVWFLVLSRLWLNHGLKMRDCENIEGKEKHDGTVDKKG